MIPEPTRIKITSPQVDLIEQIIEILARELDVTPSSGLIETPEGTFLRYIILRRSGAETLRR